MDTRTVLRELLASPSPVVAWNAACWCRPALDGTEAGRLRQAMLDDPAVRAVVAGLADWPGEVLNSHKSARQAFHRLAWLADIGLNADDPGLEPVVERILASRDQAGVPSLGMEISPAHGGDGSRRQAWALCDAPVTLWGLWALGVAPEELEAGTRHLAGLAGAEGWPCAVSPALGGWRGPGRKADPCPYATLVMTRLLAEAAARLEAADLASLACRGAHCLLGLWTESRERHPYLFYMGTDFRKLKLPFVWYDLLHVADVLSRIPRIHDEPAFREMLDSIAAKAGPGATFVPESVWLPWAGQDFGQKKQPSDWMRFCVARIFRRLESDPAGA